MYKLTLYLLLAIIVQSRDIVIHVIPHSHMDPMWLFRTEEYTQRADLIMDGVLQVLLHDKHKTFTWEGVYFLHQFLLRHGAETSCDRWNQRITDTCLSMHQILIHLLHRKQLEIVGGSYTAFDEALTNSYAALNSIVTGRQVLTHFNITPPSLSWFIDSFGHASSTSGLLVGFDYTHQVLNRLPYAIKHRIQSEGPLYFAFDISHAASTFHFTDSSHSSNSISTYVLPFHYSSPFNIRLESDLSDIDAVAYSAQLVEYFSQLPPSSLQEQHVMLLLGDDFAYRKTEKAYRSVDKIIKHLNSLSKALRTAHTLHMRYSTPSKFFAALSTPTMHATGNLLPYSDNIANDWTGYFGSRPVLKSIVMSYQRRLQILEIFIVGALLNEEVPKSDTVIYYNKLQRFHEFLALCYHHDTITGTSRSNVIEDFILKLRYYLNDIDKTMQQLVRSEHDILITSGNNFNDSLDVSRSEATLLVVNTNPFDSLPAHITIDVGCENTVFVSCDDLSCQILSDYDAAKYSCSSETLDMTLQKTSSLRIMYHILGPYAVESFSVSPQGAILRSESKLNQHERNRAEIDMRYVLDHLSLHVFVSGKGWHSSGAYLMRSALNPVFSVAVVVGVAFVLSFPVTFISWYMNCVKTKRVKYYKNSSPRQQFILLLIALFAYCVVVFHLSRRFIEYAELWTHPLLPMRLSFFIHVSRYSAFYVAIVVHVIFAEVIWVSGFDITKYRSFIFTFFCRLFVSCFLYALWFAIGVGLVFLCPLLQTPAVPMLPLNAAVWQHGIVASEVTWQAHNDVLLRMRYMREINTYELDIFSTVAAGHELFVRYDLKSIDSDASVWIAETHDSLSSSEFQYAYASPVSANYFPIISQATLTSRAAAVRLAVSQPTGMVVMEDVAQVIVHRSCSFDDEKGLTEPIIDTSRSFVSISATTSSATRLSSDPAVVMLRSVQPDIVSTITKRLNNIQDGIKRLRSLLPMEYRRLDIVSHRLITPFPVLRVETDTIVSQGCNLDCSTCPWSKCEQYASDMKLVSVRLMIS